MLNATTAKPALNRKEGKLRVESTRATTTSQPLTERTTDAELLALVCRGEQFALAQLYDRYSRLVFSIGLRVVGDRELAEEVVQDVFQAVWQSAGAFQPGASVSAWLIGITRHRAIDATRSRRFRARQREDLLGDDRAGQVVFAHDGPADALALRAAVRGALAALPAAQRQAIELGYYGGLTQSEIAARLGEPVGTVKSRMRMGLGKLRELLVEVDGEY